MKLRALILGTACLVGCESFNPQAVVTPAPTPIPRLKPSLAFPIAVVDFTDNRPGLERGPEAFQEPILRAEIEERPFWALAGEESRSPIHSEADSKLKARYTGDGAFSWFPYPYLGSQLPASRPAADGLSDYFALLLDRRGLVQRVFRARSQEDAFKQGAVLVLHGSLDHFAGVFLERELTAETPSDDLRRFDYSTRIDLTLQLVRRGGGVVWRSRLLHEPPLDDPHLYDQMELLRDSRILPLSQLAQQRMPEAAYDDVVRHMQRALRRLALDALEQLEATQRKADSSAS
jgi:hypothetical protein